MQKLLTRLQSISQLLLGVIAGSFIAYVMIIAPSILMTQSNFHGIVLEKMDRIESRMPTRKARFEAVGEHVFKVVTQGWSGTAWRLKNTQFAVTNAHVCGEPQNQMTLIHDDGKEIVTQNYIKHENLDVCLIDVGEVSRKGLELSSTNVKQFDNVFIVGYPRFIKVYREGYVENFEADDLLTFMLTGPGSSGSPVLNENMEVVGLHYGAYVPYHMSIAVELDALRIAINRLKEVYFMGPAAPIIQQPSVISITNILGEQK